MHFVGERLLELTSVSLFSWYLRSKKNLVFRLRTKSLVTVNLPDGLLTFTITWESSPSAEHPEGGRRTHPGVARILRPS